MRGTAKEPVARTPVRIIQAGLGGWGRNWYANVLKGHGDLEVVAWVDADGRALKAAAKESAEPPGGAYESLEQALAAVEAEAVLITASLPGHVPLALAALGAGKHVLVEKPFAPTVSEASRVVEEAERADRVIMVSQNYRFYPAPVAVAELVRRRELGRLGSVQLDFRKNRISQKAGSRKHFRLANPLLVDMAIHHMDLIRFVTGQEVRRLCCRTWNPPWSRFEEPPAAALILEMDEEIVVDYHGSWVSSAAETAWAGEWRMEFARGEVRWTSRGGQDAEADRVVVRGSDGAEREQKLPVVASLDRRGSVEAFVRTIRGWQGANRREGYQNAGVDNRRSLALVLAAIESARTGRPVEPEA